MTVTGHSMIGDSNCTKCAYAAAVVAWFLLQRNRRSEHVAILSFQFFQIPRISDPQFLSRKMFP